MDYNNDIINLVKSLNPYEKRYLKACFLENRMERRHRLLEMFKIIEEQKEYDEEETLRIYGLGGDGKNFASDKFRLYQAMLKIMRVYHSGRTVESGIREWFADVEFLFEKKLYKECYRILDKIRVEAYRYEKFLYVLEVIRLERRLATVSGYRYTSGSDYDRMDSEETELMKKISGMMDYRRLSNLVFSLIRKYGFIRGKKQEDEFRKILNYPILKKEEIAKTVEGRVYFNQIYYFYWAAKKEWDKAYSYSRKVVDILRDNPHRVLENPVSYIMSLNNFMLSCREAGRDDEFLKEINELKKLPGKLPRHLREETESLIFIYTVIPKTSFFIKKTDYIQVIRNIPVVLKGIKRQGEQFGSKNRLIFYYLCAISYFALKDYSESLRWLNRCLHDPDLRNDAHFQVYLQVFHIILQYELGNTDILEFLVRSIYRLLIRSDSPYRFENILLDFIRKQLPDAVSPQSLLMAFRKLKNTLVEISVDPFEQVFLEYFDIISWLESKISGKPFLQILKEKTGENPGKE